MSLARILDLLAQRPHTAEELSDALSIPRADVRNELGTLVFQLQTVTCDEQGRFTVGDPTALLNAGPRPGVPRRPAV